jgi:hypothetical protein
MRDWLLASGILAPTNTVYNARVFRDFLAKQVGDRGVTDILPYGQF